MENCRIIHIHPKYIQIPPFILSTQTHTHTYSHYMVTQQTLYCIHKCIEIYFQYGVDVFFFFQKTLFFFIVFVCVCCICVCSATTLPSLYHFERKSFGRRGVNLIHIQFLLFSIHTISLYSSYLCVYRKQYIWGL